MIPDFKVSFGRIGRTLTYEDEGGTLLFTFDFAMPDGKRIIISKTSLTANLKPISSDLSEAEQSRLKMAHERVKQYVISCGYKLLD